MDNQINEPPSKRPRIMDQVNYNFQLPTAPVNNGQPYFFTIDIRPSSTSYSLDPQMQFLEEGGAPLLNHNYVLPDPNLEYGDNCFSSLPLGFRFCPTDDELLHGYLIPKVLRLPLSMNKIPVVNLYDHNPETLTATYEKCGESKCYFFTTRSKKYPNGKRPRRSAADGFWKPTSGDLKVTDTTNGKLLGYRKAIVYYRGTFKKNVKTNWTMREFRVSEEVARAKPSSSSSVSDPMLLDEWVLCRIYHKPQKANDTNGSRGVDDDHDETPTASDTTAPPTVNPSGTPAIETPVAAAAMTAAFNDLADFDFGFDFMDFSNDLLHTWLDAAGSR